MTLLEEAKSNSGFSVSFGSNKEPTVQDNTLYVEESMKTYSSHELYLIYLYCSFRDSVFRWLDSSYYTNTVALNRAIQSFFLFFAYRNGLLESVDSAPSYFNLAKDFTGTLKESYDFHNSSDEERADSNIKEGADTADSESANVESDRFSVGWFKILNSIRPGSSKGGSRHVVTWSKVSPSTASLRSEEFYLPHYTYEKDFSKRSGSMKPTIFLAVDFSESVSPEVLSSIEGIVRSSPSDIFDIKTLTWSEDVVLYDERKHTVKQSSTNIDRLFSQISLLCAHQNIKEHYVVVVTDGETSFTSTGNRALDKDRLSKVRENWFWVATGDEHIETIQRNMGKYGAHKVFVLDSH